jgi:hypothetical protein
VVVVGVRDEQRVEAFERAITRGRCMAPDVDDALAQ